MRATFLLTIAAFVSGCPLILGVDGEYTLATVDAAEDGSVDGPGGETVDGDPAGRDAAVDSESDTPKSDLDAAAGDAIAIPDADSDGLLFGPTPGQVQPCGAGACTATTDSCCINEDAGAFCIPRQDACNGQRPSRFNCDERADCPVGEECCGQLDNSFFRVSATCLPIGDCLGAAQTVLCRTHAECESSECVPWACSDRGPVYSTCDGLGYHPGYCY